MTDRTTKWLFAIAALRLCSFALPLPAQAQNYDHSQYVQRGSGPVGRNRIVPPALLEDATTRFPMLTVMMWQRFRPLKAGMTPEQAMQAGPFYPIRPQRHQHPGWCTFYYAGRLTQAEQKALTGKLMQIDVQVVMRSGPVSASNPPIGSLNPTMTGETIANVSAPYAGDGGALCLD